MGVGPASSPGTLLSPLWTSLPDGEGMLITNSVDTTSVCGPDLCYGQGSNGGQNGCMSGGWYLMPSTGDWVCRRLLVGGFPLPSVSVTWLRLAVAATSIGDAVGSLVSP